MKTADKGGARRKPRATKPRPANAIPWWKLKLLLPDSRKFVRLRLVQLPDFLHATDHGQAVTMHPWQFQHRDGRPAGVGLFAFRENALAWAKTHIRDGVVSATDEEVA